MIRLFFIAFIFFTLPVFAYYNLTVPVNGDTIADEELQLNTVKKIYGLCAEKYPICSDYSIKNTQVIQYPRDTKKIKNKYVSGYWKELWTVEACGQSKQIPVTFYLHPYGAVPYIDKSFLNR